jgi:PAS domain S-box-containing protein
MEVHVRVSGREYTAAMTPLRRFARSLNPHRLRHSISARVLGGFFLTIALAVAVALISLAYNMEAGRGLARVAERDREISANLHDLEVAVEQQSGAVQSYLLSDEDERDLTALNAARARFAAALAALESRLPEDQRGEAWAQILEQAQALDEIADEEIALSRQGWGRSAIFLWRTEGVDTRNALLAAVQEQLRIHNAAIDEEIAASQADLRFSFGLSLALIALAAILALMIGFSVSRAVRGPVKNLIRVAGAVRAGDYSVRAPVQGDDELAVLTGAINTMVDSLQASRMRLEQALVETERSEERYRLLTENANDLIFTLDRQNRFTFINPAVKRMLGYEAEELIGTPAAALITDQTRELIIAESGWVTRPPYTFTGDIEFVAKDGQIVPVEVNSSVMRIGGVSVGIQGIARDMTDRYRMEYELRRLHAQDRRRVDQLTTLNEMGRKIAALQPVDEMLPHLVQMLGKTFGYHYVRILLVDEIGDLDTAAAWGPSVGDEVDGGASPLALRALRGDAGFVAGSGRPEDDASTRYTEVAVPIRTKTGVLGVLDIRGSADSGLDESDIFTLQTLADQAAIAIENARLFEAGQQLAVSEERNRLARELHDSVTQELFSMTMIAGALPALIEKKPESARERVQRLNELARGALAEMRALLFALRPAALAEEGLVAAITKHAAAVESREGITVHEEITGDGRLPHACEEALYRVFQEAVNNVIKHARAQNIWVNLAIGAEETSLTVRDDGIGLAAGVQGGTFQTMGLASMRERVEALGGSFTIESAPGDGTMVHATIPVGCDEPTGTRAASTTG